MRYINYLAIAFVIMLSSCNMGERERTLTDEPMEYILAQSEQAFFDNLRSLCGKSFAGEESFIREGRESWADKDFVMHVTVCEEDRVYIPFHVGEDKSRTWMFLVEDGKLRFRHDHRHEDGTPEDTTLYGGYSDSKGSDLIQCFPEDEYTIELLSDHVSRQWNIVLSEDMSTMTYELYADDELVFAVEFDLTKPL